MAQKDRNRDLLVKEYSLLKALSMVAATEDGKLVLGFILSESNLDYDPFVISKNSGDTSHTLGKQSVGRALVDKLIEAGVTVPGSVFSKKTDERMEWLSKEIHKSTQGDN